VDTRARRYRAGIDIGGTFTDVVVVDDRSGAFAVSKALTTPDDPSAAIQFALEDALSRLGHTAGDLGTIVHGTTLVTNAIIERKGDRTALLATEGFRDALEIARENRFDLYDLNIAFPRPLVPRYLRFGVPQRTLADGTTLRELDVAYVERLARELAANGIQSVAICFVHSYANPEAERQARAAVRRVAPKMRVTLSSDVAPEMREYERTSTAVANVYVQGRVERYLRELQARLARMGFDGTFLMMLSSGGVATADTAAQFPIRLLESGPAAGALAAAHHGRVCGRPELLSFDMGGTTAKFCVIDGGEPLVAHEFEFDRAYRFKKGSGLPARVSAIEMIEIGAGGGSIARVDGLGLLKVGPESAGSDPGPACYARGGTMPTVTDADLVLGYLDPGYFLGGRMRLDLSAAIRAIEAGVARPLGASVEDAALGIHAVVNQGMANAARVHALERGKDPARFPLFAFGGAGPVHGHRIAQALGAPEMIAPFGAGVLSAVGFLVAPLAFDAVRSWHAHLDELDWQRAAGLLAELEADASGLLVRSGVAPGEVRVRREADMRYIGQGHEIRVVLPGGEFGSWLRNGVIEAFRAEYLRLYGRLGPPVPIEILHWRVAASGPRPEVRLALPGVAGSNPTQAIKGERRAHFQESGAFVATPVYDRYRLRPGARLAGPAIVEERESTVIVGPGASCEVDGWWNLIVKSERQRRDPL
jgi:N-methylhydantoinase A